MTRYPKDDQFLPQVTSVPSSMSRPELTLLLSNFLISKLEMFFLSNVFPEKKSDIGVLDPPSNNTLKLPLPAE